MSKPAPAIKPKPKKVQQFRAMYDFDGSQYEKAADVLTFEEGDVITLLSKVDDNWAQCRVKGKTGMVPLEYVDEANSQVFPLHEACRRGNLTQVKAALREKTPVNQKDKTNATAMHWAASAGYIDCVSLLLSTGFCDLTMQNMMGETPLHIAAAKGHCEVVKLLVQENPKIVNMKNKSGKTAFQLTNEPMTKGYLHSVSGQVNLNNIDLAASDEDEISDDD